VGLKGGGFIYDREGKRMKHFPGEGGGRHMANFLDAVRSRRTEDLNAPVLQGHFSSTVCHLGNLSWRLGRTESLATCRDAVRSHPGAAETVDQLAGHLTANEIATDRNRFVLGPWLDLDAANNSIAAVSGGDSTTLAHARALAQGSHRPAYSFDA
jgi:hypothetical protein